MRVWDRRKLGPERSDGPEWGHWGRILCVACVVAVSRAPCAGAELVTPSRGTESGRNDVVYLAPATEPYEALPLGNGLPGVMVSNPRDGMTYKFHHSSFFASADENQMLWSSGELDVNVPDAWMAGLSSSVWPCTTESSPPRSGPATVHTASSPGLPRV